MDGYRTGAERATITTPYMGLVNAEIERVRLFCDDQREGVRWPEREQAFAQSDGCGAERSSGEMPAGWKLLRRRTLSVLSLG